MKQSKLTFAEGFLGTNVKIAEKQGETQKSFDWDKAAGIIRKKYKEFPNLIAEAGLQGDWAYTGGIIFENGKPTNDNYTYLSSNWAIPTLLLFNDDVEIAEIEFDKYERKNVDYKDEQYCFKYVENTQLAYIAGFKKCRSMLKHIIHAMEHDSLYPKPINKQVFKVLQQNIKKLKSI